MVKPTEVTDFNRTPVEQERFLLFGLLVAGKDSDITARCLDRLLADCPDGLSPILWLAGKDKDLHNILVAHRVGQYGRIERAIRELAELLYEKGGIDQVDLKDLLSIHGIGPKTARFFLLHTRADADCVVLDTHVLKWLRRHGMDWVPEATPSPVAYEKIEPVARLLIRAAFPSLSMAEADLAIWMQESGRLT